MDLTTRLCHDCLFKCYNCVNGTDCYDTCRGDRIWDDGSGVHCNCAVGLVDDGISENCNCKKYLFFINNYK